MTVMRANLNLSEATRRGVGLEALRAASNAAPIQKCLTRNGLWLRIGRSGVRLSQPGFQPSTAQAALESPARSHNHGVSEFFSTLLGFARACPGNSNSDGIAIYTCWCSDRRWIAIAM